MLDDKRAPKLRKEKGEQEKDEKAEESKQAAKRKKTSGKAPTPAVLSVYYSPTPIPMQSHLFKLYQCAVPC